MAADDEGFLYPSIDEGLCVDCSACVHVCPMLVPIPEGAPPQAFAAWHKDENVRAESSSGGVFSALMSHTLEQGGVVFGAAFDDGQILRHQLAQNEEEGRKFRGSKYLQSEIGGVYREVQDFLRQGRQVLFSGTPCQVAGLYAYLGRDDDNLLTVDLVCHGVPSPKVFAAYREAMERRYRAKIRRIAFRRKDCGWKRFSVALSFDNATEYRRVFTDDPFMIGFLRDLYLRPSCHACRFSRLPRVADITLADFWGVGGHHPEWDDDRGTSLILVQTRKGQKAFDVCREFLTVHEANLLQGLRSNPCICGSVAPGEKRASFFSDLDRDPFEKVVKKYLSPQPFWRKFFRKIKNVVVSRVAS